MVRNLRFSAVAAVALLALAASFAPADAAQKGTFSLGANFGTGIYSNKELNDALGPDVEELTSGWEMGGSLRYQVSPKLGLDLEFNRMKPAANTPDPGNPDFEVSTPGMAIPLSLYYQLSENDKYTFNVFGGAGMVTSTKVHVEQEGNPDETNLNAAASFYGQAGLEAQWHLSRQFGLNARALGRMAKSEIDDTDPAIDIDYGGFAFGLGARMSFGGGAQ